MTTKDCVYRQRKILPSTPLTGLVLSETEDFCLPKGKSIPYREECDKTCKLYASRYITEEK